METIRTNRYEPKPVDGCPGADKHRNTKKQRWLLLLLCLSCLAALNALNTLWGLHAQPEPPSIVGYWSYCGLLGAEFDIAFAEDGSVTDSPFGKWGASTYETEADRVYIKNFWGVKPYTFDVQGDFMTFTDKDNHRITFTRLP